MAVGGGGGDSGDGGDSKSSRHQHPSPPNFTFQRELEGHDKAVAAVRFSPDGTRLASASADKTVKVWRVSDGELLVTLKGHEKGCSDCAWTSDGRYLVSASDDKNLHLWDVDPGSQYFGRTLRIFAGHTSHVFCCNLNHPANNILASGSCDETVRLWDVHHGTVINVLPAHSDPVTSSENQMTESPIERAMADSYSTVQFSRDGTVLVTSSYDGLCRLWSVATVSVRRASGGRYAPGACLKTFIDDNNPPISSVRFSPNSKYLLSGSMDSTLRLWDIQRGKAVKVYKGHENKKFCLFSTFATLRAGRSDGESPEEGDVVVGGGGGGGGGGKLEGALPPTYVVCGSEDCGIYVWELQSQQLVQRIAGAPALDVDAAAATAATTAATDDKTPEGDGMGANGDGVRTDDAGTAPEGGDAMEVDAGSGGGDGGRSGEEAPAGGSVGAEGGDGGDVHGHRDAVIGIDFAASPGGGGVLASSGLEKDKTIKLWVTR